MTVRVIRHLFKYVVLLLVAAYFLIAGLLLVTKYWVLPEIDNWRPQIETSLSEALGVPVKLGKISAEWQGLAPSFELSGLTISDREGEEAVVIPRIEAVFAWRSLVVLEPRFRYIGIEGLALAVRRDERGTIHIAGFNTDSDESGQESPSVDSLTVQPWYRVEPVRWLLSQRRIDLNDAIVIWIDEQRSAPPLKIESLSFTLRNRLLSHRLEGRFDLAIDSGQHVEFVFENDRFSSVMEKLGEDKVDGQLYVSLSDVEPLALAPWVDLPVVSGRYATRAWFDLSQTRLSNVTLDVAAISAGSDIPSPDAASWSADSFSVYASGPASMLVSPEEYPQFISSPGSQVNDPVTVRVQANGLYIAPPSNVMSSVKLDQMEFAAQMRKRANGDLKLTIKTLEAQTPDGLLSLKGMWDKTHDSAAGSIDVRGTLTKFDLSRLYHYMPTSVDDDVTEWLRHAFKRGLIPQASIILQGPLESFPFENESEGVLSVEGTLANWVVDYAPAESPEVAGWPALVDLDGTFTLNRNALSVQAKTGALKVTDDTRIAINSIQADMTDLFSSPLLELKATTTSTADSYQQALTRTALVGLVPAIVSDIKGEGDWNLNLDLAMPLENIEQVTFNAELNLNGGSLRYADLPQFEKITGKMAFSKDGFTTEGLKAHVLGGDILVTGGFGKPDESLNVTGSLGVAALNAHLKQPSLNQWLKGQLPFELNVSQPAEKGPFKIALDSTLEGLQINFPPPLNLATNRSLNTHLEWEIDSANPAQGKGSLNMGNVVRMNATTRESQGSTALASMALGIGTAPNAVSNGMTVNIKTKDLNATAWMNVYESLMKDLSADSSSSSMPSLVGVQLASEKIIWNDTTIDQVNANLRVADDRYSMDLDSKQAKGTLAWRMNKGEFFGRLQARLSKLVVGEESAAQEASDKVEEKPTEPDLPDETTLSSLPPIELTIDELTLYGMKVGRLELVGENQADKKRWKIQKFELTDPNAQLSATGQWRFEKGNPGINAEVTLQVTDLGLVLANLGKPDQVRRGHGTIKAQVDWVNFPWLVDFEGLTGKVQVDIEEGIFDHINSKSARVLELLSLQSFSRLLDLNVNSNESFEKGFPWSSIRGNLNIDKGAIHTNDLAIDSPVATITFRGGTSLKTEQWNLKATVRPSFDLSGSAMATGFLLNPIIGLSALVGNYILKHPIESALSIHYDVTGPWNDPELKEVGASTDPLSPAEKELQEATKAQQNEQGKAGTQQSSDAPESAPEPEVHRIELGKTIELGQQSESTVIPKVSAQQESIQTNEPKQEQNNAQAQEAPNVAEPKPDVYRIELGKSIDINNRPESSTKPSTSAPPQPTVKIDN